jgi:hypothetical protein
MIFKELSIFEKKIRIQIHSLRLATKYRPWGKSVEPGIVYMLDDYKRHCGLADRIKQILGVYAFCKNYGVSFGLIANYPFELADYLKPKYSWRVPENKFSRNLFYARPLYLGFRSKKKYKSLLLNKNKQQHVYASVYRSFVEDYGYTEKQLFHELFEPVDAVTDYIENYKKQYTEWDTMHFRFVNLLGDFNELSLELDENEKRKLMKKCLDFIQDKVQSEKKYFLICSDSITFLQEASKISNVIVLPGEPAHMDFASEEDFNFHLKTFHDFFMISESKKVYGVVSGKMYGSGFPKLAAQINDIPFERVAL